MLRAHERRCGCSECDQLVSCPEGREADVGNCWVLTYLHVGRFAYLTCSRQYLFAGYVIAYHQRCIYGVLQRNQEVCPS